MRRIIFSAAMSLDGYIAGPKGEYDWIPHEPEIDWKEFLDRFDTVLMGRKSYEAVLGGPSLDTFAGMSLVVASRTLDPTQHPGVTVVSKDLQVFVEGLRRPGGKDIWLFGGGELLRTMLELGRVDHLEVALVPVILGSGVPLLPPWNHRSQLSLETAQTYDSGIVLLTYEVRPNPAD